MQPLDFWFSGFFFFFFPKSPYVLITQWAGLVPVPTSRSPSIPVISAKPKLPVLPGSIFYPGPTQSFMVGSSSKLKHPLLHLSTSASGKEREFCTLPSTPNQGYYNLSYLPPIESILFPFSLCFYPIHDTQLCPSTNRVPLRVSVGREICVVVKRTRNSSVGDNIHWK